MNATRQVCLSGLNTDTYKIVTAGVYSLYVRSTEIPPSGVVITLSQTGSTSASFTTPTTSPIQNHVEINAKFNCAVGDVLSVALSSSASADQPPNMIKTTINLRMGV
jgi:hypothetical protein